MDTEDIRGRDGVDPPSAPSRALEAALFAARGPVRVEDLERAIGMDLTDAIADVAHRRGGGGLRLVRGKGTLSLVPEASLLPPVEAARGLSRAAMSCAVAVAMHGPVSLKTLETLRGVRVRPSIMSDLEAAGFVQRWDGGGRTGMWIVGPAFLDAMGLTSVDDMPTPEEVGALDLGTDAGRGPD